MSAHPFQRMLRNLAASIIIFPVHDGSTRFGKTLVRWGLRIMYPADSQMTRRNLNLTDEWVNK